MDETDRPGGCGAWLLLQDRKPEATRHMGPVAALIEQHEPARRDERLLWLLLPYGDVGVIDGLDAIASPCATTLSLGRGNA